MKIIINKEILWKYFGYVFCIVLACTCIMIFISYYYFTSESVLQENAIITIKEEFGIDISNVKFGYKNQLLPFASGNQKGTLKVWVSVDEKNAESWKIYCSNEFYFDEDGEFEENIEYLFGIEKDEINESIYVDFRHENIYYGFFSQTYDSIRYRNYIYFHNNLDGTVTVYFYYYEPKRYQ